MSIEILQKISIVLVGRMNDKQTDDRRIYDDI